MVKELWKSVKTWQSYHYELLVYFFRDTVYCASLLDETGGLTDIHVDVMLIHISHTDCFRQRRYSTANQESRPGFAKVTRCCPKAYIRVISFTDVNNVHVVWLPISWRKTEMKVVQGETQFRSRPRTYNHFITTSAGQRSFSVSGPTTWNCLSLLMGHQSCQRTLP